MMYNFWRKEIIYILQRSFHELMAFFLDIHVINRKLYSCGIFIDLKKAFDRVDVNIMSLTSATKARKTISIITKTLLLTWWEKFGTVSPRI